MATHNPTEEKFLAMYERIGMGNCRTCSICRANVENLYPPLSPPLTAWGVGNNFINEHKKILFVGKNARGYFSKPLNGKFHEVFDDSRHTLWQKKRFPYWNYTREITKKIFGDSFEHIACTNLVKCNNSPDKDTTPDLVKRNCIRDLKVFSEEVKIIRPTHIIFYTNQYYDEYIPHAFDTFKILFNGTKRIGAKDVPWDNVAATIEDLKFCVLVTGHPERLNKDEFTNAICSWIKTT